MPPKAVPADTVVVANNHNNVDDGNQEQTEGENDTMDILNRYRKYGPIGDNDSTFLGIY